MSLTLIGFVLIGLIILVVGAIVFSLIGAWVKALFNGAPVPLYKLVALKFADLLLKAGLPGPMLSVLLGPTHEIAETLVQHPAVDVVGDQEGQAERVPGHHGGAAHLAGGV